MTGCIFITLSVLSAIAYGQPVNNQQILKDVPTEVFFRVEDSPRPFSLDCVLASGQDAQIEYKWVKNGAPLEVSDNPDIVQRKGEGSLVFLSPKASDEGDYICRAGGPQGVARTRVIKVRRAYMDIAKYEISNHKPIEGKPFKLECPLPKAYPKPTIEWRSVMIADPTMTEVVSDRRIIVGPDSALYFANVTNMDTSPRFKYVCMAKSPAVDEPVPVAEHIITDLEENKNEDNELVKQFGTPDSTLKVGEMVYLFCIYGGNPQAHPDWFKDGKDINNKPGDRVTRYNRSQGKRLLIREVLPEDEGTYTCTVDNEIGKRQEHTFKINVVGAPKFEQKPEKQMNIAVGDKVTIPCKVSGMPAPDVKYYYNTRSINVMHIKHSGRFALEPNGITIKSVQKGDMGFYGCEAKNEHGSEYAETFLKVA